MISSPPTFPAAIPVLYLKQLKTTPWHAIQDFPLFYYSSTKNYTVPLYLLLSDRVPDINNLTRGKVYFAYGFKGFAHHDGEGVWGHSCSIHVT
jgi:hypothetical protein